MASDGPAQRFDAVAWLRHHAASARMALAGIPYWVWPLPALLWIAVLLIMQTPFRWITEKDVLELISPMVLALAAGTALFVHRWARESFTLMLACFCWALFFRELHFTGTSRGIYAALIVLAWWASSRRDEILPFLARRPVAALLSGAAWTYFITKQLDRHNFGFLPNYRDWNNNVEESLETLAHLMVFALVVATLRAAWLLEAKRGKSGGA